MADRNHKKMSRDKQRCVETSQRRLKNEYLKILKTLSSYLSLKIHFHLVNIFLAITVITKI